MISELPDIWLFVAGLVDAGESPETAAVRELYEETGYTASVKHVTPGKSVWESYKYD